jgi:hypothetical protein
MPIEEECLLRKILQELQEIKGLLTPKKPLHRPFERVPHAYTLMIDMAPSEDELWIVGLIHMLPDRGKSKSTEVTGTSLHRVGQMEALLATLGANLKTVVTYCPEKLVVYTDVPALKMILEEEEVQHTSKRSLELAGHLREDLAAVRRMFPVEVKVGIPEGHKEEIKSLIAQAELEYIRQKEKDDVAEHNRNNQGK